MAKYLIIIEGYDPTSNPSTPTNAELLQMIREAQYADDVGGLILSQTTPDVVQYPILARFRWAKTNASLIPIGEWYYHDGSSWVLEKPAPGTVTAASIADGTITLDKLNAGGDPYNIIRINSTGDAFEFATILTTLSDGTLPYTKFVPAAGANYLFISTTGGVWTAVTASAAADKLFQNLLAATAFDSTSDKVPFLKATDNKAYGLTVPDFYKGAFTILPVLGTTQVTDKVLVYDGQLVKAVALADLLPDAGVVANTYSYPSSVTVNSKGQITAIVSGTGSAMTAVGTGNIPVAGTPLVIAHGMSPNIPSSVRAVAKCIVANNNYAVNDEVDVSQILWNGANSAMAGLVVTADATNITVTRNHVGGYDDFIYLSDKITGDRFNFGVLTSSWQIKVYAAR